MGRRVQNILYAVRILLVLGILVSTAGAAVCDGPPSYVGFNFAPGSGPTRNAPYLISLEGVAYPSPGGDPVTTWYWDFGDGTGAVQGSGIFFQNPSHPYLTAGIYTITFRAATSCNIWSVDRTYTITVNPPTLTINPVSNVNYGDVIQLSGTDTSGGTIVRLQMEGPSTPLGISIADVPVQAGTWSYSWDTATLPAAGTYTVWAFDQSQHFANTTIDLIVIVTPTSGKISATSSPSGATMFLDGVPKGTTPITVSSVTTGTHTVDLTLSGYQDYHATITVVAGQIATVTATLPSIPTTGGLSISSTPSGATILVDGVKSGVTPMAVEMYAGSHVVKLQKAGYADYTGTFTVMVGKVSPVTIQLVALPQTTTVTPSMQQTTSTGGGTLTIQSIPTNAEIRLDGVAQGTTPKSISNLKAGAHIVTLSYPGYNDWTGTVTIVAGGTMPITITLVAKSAMPFGTLTSTVPLTGLGSLVIRSTPEGATVYLNSESRGVTPLTLTNLSPGIHRILLTHPGYSDYQEVVQISSGQQSIMTAEMAAGQKSPGFEGVLAIVALGAVLVLWRLHRS